MSERSPSRVAVILGAALPYNEAQIVVTRGRRPRPEEIEAVDDVMAEVYARKSGAERLAIAAGLFRSAQSMLLSHLRQEHPEWSETRLCQEVARRISHGAL